MEEKKKTYETFDLLSPLTAKNTFSCVRAEGCVYETDEGKRLVDMNEMRVVLGQKNRNFESAMTAAINGITAPKGGIPENRLKLYRYF